MGRAPAQELGKQAVISDLLLMSWFGVKHFTHWKIVITSLLHHRLISRSPSVSVTVGPVPHNLLVLVSGLRCHSGDFLLLVDGSSQYSPPRGQAFLGTDGGCPSGWESGGSAGDCERCRQADLFKFVFPHEKKKKRVRPVLLKGE